MFAALLLTAGRVGDRYGRRTLFLVGLVVFAIGSVIAALSTALAPLIIARIIQGLGGACILPATLSSVNALFRGPDRATAFGIWGAVMAGAAAVGPLAGGLLTQYAGWQAIFWINVPIAIVLVIAAIKVVPNTSARTEVERTTALLVAVGEFSLVFVLPLYLVSAVGLSTIATGLVLAAMAFGAFLSGAMARHLARLITPAGVVILGLGLEVFGSLQLAAEEHVGLPLWLVVFALVVYGIGLGLASAQLTSLVLGDIPVHLSGQASATQSMIRQVGSALGAALGGIVLSLGLTAQIADLPPQLQQMGEGLKSFRWRHFDWAACSRHT